MRPEKDVRLLWSKLTLRKLLNSSGGHRSTVLRWENKITFIFHFIIILDMLSARIAQQLPNGTRLQGEIADVCVVCVAQLLCHHVGV